MSRHVQVGCQVIWAEGVRPFVLHVRQSVLRRDHAVLWDRALRRFERVPKSGHVAVADVASVCTDARHFELSGGDCVAYFFNPFDGAVLAQTVERTLATARRNDRRLSYVCSNLVFAGVFAARPELKELAQSRLLRWRMALFSPYAERIFKRGS